MAERQPSDNRTPADIWTAERNDRIIAREMGQAPARNITRALRQELREKIPEGNFKRGGRVHRTGIYKLHRGERVVPARSRRARRR